MEADSLQLVGGGKLLILSWLCLRAGSAVLDAYIAWSHSPSGGHDITSTRESAKKPFRELLRLV